MAADTQFAPDAEYSSGLSSLRSGEYLSALRNQPIMTAADERQLLCDYRAGNVAAGEQVVLANMRGVVFIAWTFKGYGLPIEDLVQEGFIGMSKALPRFNPECDVRFMTYALHWIKEAIFEYVLRNYRIVRPVTTKDQRKVFFNLRRKRLHSGPLRSGEARDLAHDLGISEKTIHSAVSFFSSDVSLDQKAHSTGLSDDDLAMDSATPEAIVESADWESHVSSRLNSALSGLPERSREIIHSRLLSEDKEQLGLKQLGQRYGVSAERIRQIEQQAFRRLRRELLTHDGSDLRRQGSVRGAALAHSVGSRG